MAIARIGELRMYYEVHGSGEPVVLVAGYTCDHTFWDAVVPALAERYAVLVFDNRAVGRTRDAGRPFTMETMAADTAALIRHQGWSRPCLVGQSMGGAVVQTMLARFPQACGPCAFVNSTPAFSTTTRLALNTLLALRKAGADLSLLVDAALPWFAGERWLADPANREAFLAALRDHPAPQSLADQERQLRALESLGMGVTPQWRSPALVISGTEDLITTVTEGQALARSLDGRYVELPGGHTTPVEAPGPLVDALVDFFTKQ
ncbi:alpha/beta fold hydrolase [Bordetella bronchialis]|uniref:AB hydrolase-1 domain-containing protein n=1 Tax=Bordetella bronchialis TaxID=463025 RepID=A0A193FWT5_9BORD|nr:alpha/beta hydrolase [Bordetella bronchialis]ANN71818.1 hypothetical protein BAU08_11230 [Bordetella bronchialis]